MQRHPNAAENHELPLISTHTHTNLSHCGQPNMSFAAVIERAADLGFVLLALTDHIHVPRITDYGAHSRQLAAYRAARDAQKLPFELVVGGEFEVAAPGHIIAPAQLVDACECIIVAPNHYQLDWVQDPPDDPRGAANHELDCIQTIVEWTPAEVIVHPFYGGGRYAPNAVYMACDHPRLLELVDRAVENGIALEIQPKFWANPAAANLADLFELWLDRGGKVALGSDAHALDRLDDWAEQYHAIVERFELKRADLWWPHANKS